MLRICGTSCSIIVLNYDTKNVGANNFKKAQLVLMEVNGKANSDLISDYSTREEERMKLIRDYIGDKKFKGITKAHFKTIHFRSRV